LESNQIETLKKLKEVEQRMSCLESHNSVLQVKNAELYKESGQLEFMIDKIELGTFDEFQ
jgi:hypothetical protein